MVVSQTEQLERMMQEYLTEANRTMDSFMDTMDAFLGGAESEALDACANRVRLSEAACDRHRRAMEMHLYSSGMSPDVIRYWHILIDLLDKVPNKAEHVANFISLTGPQVSEDLHRDIKEILMMTLKCTSHLFKAVEDLFRDTAGAFKSAQRVEFLENSVDKLERRMIRKIFKSGSDENMGLKMLNYKLIEMICGISDRAENASDRVKVLSIEMETETRSGLPRLFRLKSTIRN